MKFTSASILALLLTCALARAEEALPDNCRVPQMTPVDFSAPQDLGPGVSSIEADRLSGRANEMLRFSGNVELRQDERAIRADTVEVYNNPRRIRIDGNIAARDQDLVVSARTGQVDDEENSSSFDDVRYNLTNINAAGAAARVTRIGNTAVLEGATYSTCPGTRPAWQISAERLVLDQDTGFGTARHARFRFMDVPFLYTPAVTFPISDQRKTGFLFPSLGQDSELGLEFAAPFYWNLHPQYDATITPHVMSKRGLMLENQFRYLAPQHHGIFQVNYLPNDRQTSSDRYLYSVEHRSRPLTNWSTELSGSTVSDDDYIEDFGNDLGFVSTSYLARKAELRFRDLYTDFFVSAKAYQAVDPNITNANRPYHLLPRVSVTREIPLMNPRTNFEIAGEYSRFSHPQKTEGERLHIEPRLSYNYSNIAGFFRPALSFHLTEFDTDDGNFSRSLPLFSIDSGLFFERENRNGALQTLEPRLFYLYAPERRQDDIPVFDTTEPPFGFDTLFRRNRYRGYDRIGDANQVSFAVTTRIQEPDKSYETLRASIGQTFYFNDPDVTLNSNSVNPEARSGFVSDIIYKPDSNWSFRSSFSVDSDFRDTEVFRGSVNYNRSDSRLINLEHIYRRDELQQTGISVAWPIKENWVGLGRWLYSHSDESNIEGLLGVEYDACCWKVRMVAERHIDDTGENYDNAFYIQLVFKGLASIGSESEILEKEITGYETFE